MGARRWVGWAAAGSGVVLGAAHLAITGGSVLTGAQEPTLGHLVWVFVPVLVALAFSAAAPALADTRRDRGRWPLWVGGTAAVSTGALTLLGFASLASGADPATYFLGPGPYALPCAVLFTTLTLSHRTARTASPPDSGPGTHRTPA